MCHPYIWACARFTHAASTPLPWERSFRTMTAIKNMRPLSLLAAALVACQVARGGAQPAWKEYNGCHANGTPEPAVCRVVPSAAHTDNVHGHRTATKRQHGHLLVRRAEVSFFSMHPTKQIRLPRFHELCHSVRANDHYLMERVPVFSASRTCQAPSAKAALETCAGTPGGSPDLRCVGAS